MRNLPRIFTQHTNDSCYAYAPCGLMEWKLGVKLDPYKFYNYIENLDTGRAMRYDVVLEVAKERGVDGEDGKLYKIGGFKKITDPNGDKYWSILEGFPMLLVIDLERGAPLDNRIDENNRVHRRFDGYHAVVGMEVIEGDIRFANSWGTKFGENGYAYIPRVMQKRVLPFIKTGYLVTF